MEGNLIHIVIHTDVFELQVMPFTTMALAQEYSSRVQKEAIDNVSIYTVSVNDALPLLTPMEERQYYDSEYEFNQEKFLDEYNERE